MLFELEFAFFSTCRWPCSYQNYLLDFYTYTFFKDMIIRFTRQVPIIQPMCLA